MEAPKRIPNVVANYSSLHPLKYEQHWRENISDILQGMRRLLPKVDIDVAEAEYTELLRCEHLLKDLYPSKYIALKRSRMDNSDPTHPSEHLTGVLYHVIQNAKETPVSYKIPAALNELVSLKLSKGVLEELQFKEQDKERKTKRSPKGTPEKEKRRSRKEKQSDTDVNLHREERSLERSCSKSPNTLKENDWTMVPFDDYLKLKSTIEFQRSKIAELTNRLTHSLNIKETDETNYISNPDDEGRPTRLAERFATVYEEEWNDAFDALTMSLRWGEMDAIFHLLRIVRYIYDYCETTAKEQLEMLENVLYGPMIHPKRQYKNNDDFQCLQEGQQLLMSSCAARCAKDFRKVNAGVSVPELCVDFKEQVVRHIFKWDLDLLPAAVLNFIDKCMEIIWFMCIQEPPMVITWANDGESVNTNYYTFYSRKGKIVKQPVWPAVFLQHGGPLLTRGVVVPV
ncbi:uncharacterized protein LOC134274868 [Saccostrea cucullata]|uniref:uncharacterized protein LOC134274868 n=1 Tax=Saccostrea cuccullata TaxID=36930 RepID=UPI002ED40346